MLIASMGASAVLLFAVPHGQLSQPWPVLMGHGVAALIGVTCAQRISNAEIAGALAVGLTITAMHVGKFIHPPGGATALTAVIGGPTTRALGYTFLWRPVMLNALVIVAVGIAFNALFPWRRYPAHLVRRKAQPAGRGEETPLTHEEIRRAVRSLDSFLDITEDDVIALHGLLTSRTDRLRRPL